MLYKQSTKIAEALKSVSKHASNFLAAALTLQIIQILELDSFILDISSLYQ